ncbi:hypothetical protein GRI62_06475 [Erythrobacter arachoides]|uniref:Uncharacterized protein n=1 Tax=Aurantiacibacter arachoides TaxID=1850444 RepID=A0A844ZY88_9SPHN|nr:hypothetical protein [Aurantiacibacter arachoides]MXO93251.1 hypothetical protein [Aurantiacibacter arachoides]GGD50765.1 hypothetical protein GCM10011411_08330 [Aurantiacibacter arachoides]
MNTTIDEGKGPERTSHLDIKAVVFVLPLLLFFVIGDLALIAERRAIIETRALISNSDTRSALRPAEVADLREDLATRPLSANLLNRVLVSLQAGGEVEGDAGWALLDRLGFRAQDARYNLLLRAAAQNNGVGILRNIDILLRRGKEPEEFYGILSAFESQEGTRSLLASNLRSNPPWAADYLSNVRNIGNQVAFQNRVELLKAIETVVRIPPEDFISLMRKGIEYQDAEGLAYLDRIAGQHGPEFAPVEANDAFPTNWNFPQNNSIQSFGIDGADATVRIEFVGSRSQTIVFRHLVPAIRPQPARKFAMVAISRDGGELPQLILRIACPNGLQVIGVITSRKQEFETQSSTSCAIPRLELVAISAVTARPSTFDLVYSAEGGAR